MTDAIVMALAVLAVLVCFALLVGAFAAAVVSWVEEWFDSIGKAVAFSVACIVGGVLALAAAMWIITATEPDEPCVREETTTMYDPATKTVRPVTSCVERGVWADE